MKFIEIVVTILLKRDIFFADSGYIIGKNINRLMLLNKDLKEIHPKKQFKNYVFDNFYPLEKDKHYKSGKLYVFKIRGIDYNFMKKIHNCLSIFKSNDFEIVSASFNEIDKKLIKELYTVNPVIITVDNKPWLQKDDIELFKERIEVNLEKKFMYTFGEELNLKDKFITEINFKNRTPMYFNYKNGIRLLGNKVSLRIQDNEEAQKAAFLALAVGIGEKNSSLGAGFCSGK